MTSTLSPAAKHPESTSTLGYGPPTSTGKIPFTPPGTDRQCETAYWLWGDLKGPKPPLIILHGGPGAPGRDLQVLALLWHQQHIPVLLYDQIGCGESTHLRELRGDASFWTDELFIAELNNLRRHFEIEKFDLLGHSCGGMLATLYALTQPNGLRKLIIASSTASESLRLQQRVYWRTLLPQDMQDALATCEKEGRKDAPEYKRADAEIDRRFFFRPETWPAELLETMKYYNEDDTVGLTLYGDEALVNNGSRATYDTIPHLHTITAKTVPGGVLLTHGDHEQGDKMMAPFFTHIQARVKWVRFADSAHFAHVEESEAYLTALTDFLNMA